MVQVRAPLIAAGMLALLGSTLVLFEPAARERLMFSSAFPFFAATVASRPRQAQHEEDADAHLARTYRSDAYHFAIRFPHSWLVEEEGGGVVLARSGEASDPLAPPARVIVEACPLEVPTCTSPAEATTAYAALGQRPLGEHTADVFARTEGTPTRILEMVDNGVRYQVRAPGTATAFASAEIAAIAESFRLTPSTPRLLRYELSSPVQRLTFTGEQYGGEAMAFHVRADAPACQGEISGLARRVRVSDLFVYSDDNCTMEFEAHEDILAVTQEGCAARAGASCSFAGLYQRPAFIWEDAVDLLDPNALWEQGQSAGEVSQVELLVMSPGEGRATGTTIAATAWRAVRGDPGVTVLREREDHLMRALAEGGWQRAVPRGVRVRPIIDESRAAGPAADGEPVEYRTWLREQDELVQIAILQSLVRAGDGEDVEHVETLYVSTPVPEGSIPWERP